nr:hypothetical protein [Streptomyces sp. I6]
MSVADGVAVGYSVDGAAHTRGEVQGNSITYPGLRPSADLELLAGSNSVKEVLVLKDKGAPTDWRFPLELHGVTARLDGHGEWSSSTDPATSVPACRAAGWRTPDSPPTPTRAPSPTRSCTA